MEHTRTADDWADAISLLSDGVLGIPQAALFANAQADVFCTFLVILVCARPGEWRVGQESTVGHVVHIPCAF